MSAEIFWPYFAPPKNLDTTFCSGFTKCQEKRYGGVADDTKKMKFVDISSLLETNTLRKTKSKNAHNLQGVIFAYFIPLIFLVAY